MESRIRKASRLNQILTKFGVQELVLSSSDIDDLISLFEDIKEQMIKENHNTCAIGFLSDSNVQSSLGVGVYCGRLTMLIGFDTFKAANGLCKEYSRSELEKLLIDFSNALELE